MSFRKENKYRLSIGDMALLKTRLKRYGMQRLYPNREINSCYFDNDNYDSYKDSEEGVVPRKKIRIRWYNQELKFKKEVKITSNEGRYKYVMETPKLRNIDEIPKIKYLDNSYGIIKPSLVVKYHRSYYTYKSLRITFDENISYMFVMNNKKTIARDNEVVAEVKVPINCSDDYIQSLIPLPVSRFSKYSRGLILLNSYIR